jgi:hypothetical protein
VLVELLLPQPIPLSAEILVSVYDQEEGDAVGGDQLVGSCHVPVLKVDKNFATKPNWVLLRPALPDQEEVCGELLCSFQLIPGEDIAKTPMNDIMPAMRDCEIEVNAVGLREMLPFENTPLERPWIEVDAGDRSSEDRVQRTSLPGLRAVAADPLGRPTPNVNFLQSLTIKTRLSVRMCTVSSVHATSRASVASAVMPDWTPNTMATEPARCYSNARREMGVE